MPTGIYKRSQEQINKLLSTGFKPGNIPKHQFLKGNRLRRGVLMTSEQRQIMSDAHKGNKHSEETKRKIAEKQRGVPRPQTSGERNPNWHGGVAGPNAIVRITKPYQIWRWGVLAKSCWSCDGCGATGVKFNAHHIVSFSRNKRLRLSINNGSCLCIPCHNEFHKTYGKQNNTREQFAEFIKSKSRCWIINKAFI
jgi:5-methylcytosine-specific restriction endonuclease McrA